MEFLFENETTDFKCYYYKVNFNPQTNIHTYKISVYISKTQNKNNKVYNLIQQNYLGQYYLKIIQNLL